MTQLSLDGTMVYWAAYIRLQIQLFFVVSKLPGYMRFHFAKNIELQWHVEHARDEGIFLVISLSDTLFVLQKEGLEQQMNDKNRLKKENEELSRMVKNSGTSAAKLKDCQVE
jgi:hypothetical protein